MPRQQTAMSFVTHLQRRHLSKRSLEDPGDGETPAMQTNHVNQYYVGDQQQQQQQQQQHQQNLYNENYNTYNEGYNNPNYEQGYNGGNDGDCNQYKKDCNQGYYAYDQVNTEGYDRDGSDRTYEAYHGEGGDDMSTGDNMFGLLTGFLDQMTAETSCGVNLDQLTNEVSAQMEDFLTTGKFPGLEQGSSGRACQANEITQMQTALSNFKTCAGWDLELLIEELPDAVVALAVHCAPLVMNPSVPTSRNNDDMATCMGAIMGPNPLGQAVRMLFTSPCQTGSCLETLSKNVPDCTQDKWPIPLIGSWLELSSCLLGEQMCTMAKQMCHKEVLVLGDCLSCSEEDIVSCADIQRCALDSPLLSLPTNFLGAPFPDACEEYIEEMGVDSNNIVARYEQFRQDCSGDDANLWLASVGSDPSVVVPGTQPEDGLLSQNVNLAQKPGNSSPTQSSSSSSNPFGFGSGVLVGAIVVSLVAVFMSKRQQKQAPREREVYNTLELAEM